MDYRNKRVYKTFKQQNNFIDAMRSDLLWLE
jgi:hypothetical protein